MRVLLLGAGGKVGSVLAPGLAAAGHESHAGVPRGGMGSGRARGRRGFHGAGRRTRERRALPGGGGAHGRRHDGPRAADLAVFDALGRENGVACFVAPNFALGAVLMMRFAAEAGRHMPRAEIVELHNETKLDAPSGTARATADLLRGRRRSTRCASRASSPTRRCSSAGRGSS